MATPFTVSQTTDVTDAKVLAAQMLASLPSGEIIWFLLKHHHEFTDPQLRTIVGMTDPYWIWIFLTLCHIRDQLPQLSMERVGVIIERLSPCEVTFLFCENTFQNFAHGVMRRDNKILQMVLARTDSYWKVSLLKQTLRIFFTTYSDSLNAQQEKVPTYKEAICTTVAQSDPAEIVGLLEYLLLARDDKDYPRLDPSFVREHWEYFCRVVERAHPKRLVRFLKAYGPKLAEDAFCIIVKHADHKKLAMFWKSGAFSALTEQKALMIEASIDPCGLFLASDVSKPPSTEEAGSSTSYRMHPYKRAIDKSAIARFSPTQLRIWINHCDPEQVASYLEANFEENDDVWHDEQFEILVEMIPANRLASFLEKNRSKLTEPHFRMVIEELDHDDTLSFWKNHLPEPLGEKRRIVFRMAIGWIDFQKLMQVWENHFLEMTVEEFYLVVERVHFFIKQCGDLYTHFARFLQNHFPQLKDEQLCIMIRCSNALDIIRSDEKGENYFPHLTDKRLAIIRWEYVLNDYYSDGDVDIPLRYLTTDSMRRIVFRCEMDRVEKGTYEGNVMEYFGLLPSEWGNCGFYNLSHLTDEEFRTILEKADLEDVLSFCNTHSAELTENQRRMVAERLCKP
jgi:hypothetical protein